MLFVVKKTSGHKPSVSLRWVCLVLLSLGGHTSSYSLYCKHRGFVLSSGCLSSGGAMFSFHIL